MNQAHAGNTCSPLFVFVLSASSLVTVVGFAQSGPVLRPLEDEFPRSVPVPEVVAEQPPTLEELVKQVIIESLRDEYVDDKEWGRTTSRFDGFKTDGLRISKRSKRVNHGLWQRYKAKLIKPDQTLKLTIRQLNDVEDNPENTKTRFSISLTTRARCEATMVNWVYGAKGINGTIVADTTVRINLVVSIDPQTSFSFSDPIPKFDLNLTVDSVDLALKDIDVRQVGVFHGPGVRAMGDSSRKAIEELLERQERKIRNKLQKKLDEL